MARGNRRGKRNRSAQPQQVYPNAAGLDVGATEVRWSRKTGQVLKVESWPGGGPTRWRRRGVDSQRSSRRGWRWRHCAGTVGVLFALPFRLRADQRHDPQFVVAPVRTAHQPPAPGMDARLMPPPTQQARPPSRGFGHRRQICLNVEVCEFRMCQFSGGGHRVPGKVLAVAPISFSSLRNRFRANLSYAPWRGCTKPGTLTWRATVCGNRVGESVRSSRIERGGADLRILGVPIYTLSCPVTWSHGKRHGNGSKDARDHHANGRRSQYARR